MTTVREDCGGLMVSSFGLRHVGRMVGSVSAQPSNLATLSIDLRL